LSFIWLHHAGELEIEAGCNRCRDPDIKPCLAPRKGKGTCPVELQGKGREASPIWLAFPDGKAQTEATGCKGRSVPPRAKGGSEEQVDGL
jgi:hypothetical protein